MQDTITSYLNNFDLDIRKSRDARFMDQKVTPDVLCIIADCVVNLFNEGNLDKEFTVRDIWDSDYFNENVKALFSKPDVTEKTARSEYDKFIQQPLKMLSYAKILSCRKKGSNYFKVQNPEILEFISLKDRNAYEFLYIYLCKVLKDSDLLNQFEKFKNNNSKKEFANLKRMYLNFIQTYTNISQPTEASRIFTKVLNPFAAKNNIHGTSKGNFSSVLLEYSQLLYNRPNWRDVGKDKNKTRKQAGEKIRVEQYNNYHIEKAKRRIKRLHKSSEVLDDFSYGEATQVHHIFPSSDFPTIAHYYENLILLTPQQHYTKAHPNNNTRIISKDYQLTCLIAKSNSIEKHLADNCTNKIYSKKDFVFVINTGLEQNFEDEITFPRLKQRIIYLYNDAG